MKKFWSWSVFLLIVGAMSIASCKKDEDGPEKRPYNEITSFVIKSGNINFEAIIDKASASVTINVAPDNVDLLKDIAPTSIEVSTGATISPAFDVKQDFTKLEGVKYTVTAENGMPKVWTVKIQETKYLSYGFVNSKKLWEKSITNLVNKEDKEEYSEFIDLNKPGIATFGDYVIISRSNASTPLNMFNGETGEKVKETLNTEGIVGGNYMLANDDAGNLIGCTLGGWVPAGDYFKVYKWTAYNQAPVSFLTAPSASFGRKLSAVGDVNNKAIVSSFEISATTSASHYVWKIEGGNAGAPEMEAGIASQDIYQMLTPVSADAVKPYYTTDRGIAGPPPLSALYYIDLAGGRSIIKGPVPESDITGIDQDMFKQTGFGRKVLQVKMFTFNEARYVAVLSYFDVPDSDKFKYYLSVFDASQGSAPTKWSIAQSVSFTGKVNVLNYNTTGGLATSKEKVSEDGLKTLNIYMFASGVGVVCYQISNLAK